MSTSRQVEEYELRQKEMPLEKRIKMLEQDVSYLWDEGFYTMSNRMGRILTIVKGINNV